MMYALTEADILARVQTDANTGCWLWERGTQTMGYGCWPMPGRRSELAHRVAYAISNGPIPTGAFVCHRCDTPACVNPAHLFLGDQRANMRDCASKGRVRTPRLKGAAHPAAKLSAADIRVIREDPRSGSSMARAFGVSRTTISEIRLRKSWAHLP